MAQLLQDKSLATKFQIMIEIAAGQPNIQQKSIARSINISQQAVSQYVKELLGDGWISTGGRSNHCLTKEGVDWLLKALRETRNYINRVEKVTRNITVCAAIAGCDLSEEQPVGLVMQKGMLIANTYNGHGAKGIAITDAKSGEDIGISNIEGIVELTIGRVIVLSIPGVQKGGFRKVDLDRLKEELSNKDIIGAIGIESIIALKQIGITPRYTHGVKEAAVEAAQCGLSIAIVCVNNEVHLLTPLLEDRHVEYRTRDMGKPI